MGREIRGCGLHFFRCESIGAVGDRRGERCQCALENSTKIKQKIDATVPAGRIALLRLN